MSRQYRNDLPELSDHLWNLERAAGDAHSAALAAYPPGQRCIVRAQRYGKAVVEREALIVSTSVSLNMTIISGSPWASVSVRTQNLKTGKYRVFYPSVEVSGKPSIRVEGGAA